LNKNDQHTLKKYIINFTYHRIGPLKYFASSSATEVGKTPFFS